MCVCVCLSGVPLSAFICQFVCLDWRNKDIYYTSAYQISYRSVKPLQRYRDFCDFQNGGYRHLEFQKIRNFNGRSAVGDQYASSYQISSKTVKRLHRYGDLTVLKITAVRHLGFVKFKFLMVGAVKGHILHQRTKFFKDQSNHYGDIVIFVIFQDGCRRHLEFLKIPNFNDLSAVRGQCASSFQISSKSVKRLQRYGN